MKKRCNNCGIGIGDKYTIKDSQTGKEETKARIENDVHDFYGGQVCSWCLSLIRERGWIRKDNGNSTIIQFADGSRFITPLRLFQFLDKNLRWDELKSKVAAMQSAPENN